MDLEKLLKLADQWKNLIAILGTLLTALIGLMTEVLKWDPSAWSWREFAFALLVMLLIAILTLRSRNAHASRLIDPDALKLDPQSPEQLVGRREDLARLLNALANPLVFLVSESGCGKSALLRAGVAQDPVFATRFLPIYIDMSVLDWEDGPRRALREEFSRALSAGDPARSALDARSNQDRYSEVFSEYRKRTQRRPLVLLDQFDDYQADPRHRDRFLPKDTRVWRSADEIARENAFWRVLRQCLRSDAISIIVACRDDAAPGLDSMRFQQPVPHSSDLPRLERGLVRMIIDRLTNRPAEKPQVIANPDGGWTALRDRLVDDLEARGEILPQQLKVVLGGLRTLRRLTPAAYVRVGRLAGLQAAFIDGALRRAALVATLRYEDVLRLVIALVDRNRQPPDKAPPQSTADLAAILGARPDVATRALKRLEADEVVRPRGDANGGTTSWQLDHAYLAQPILHLERERDKWWRLLEERAQAYAEAGWRQKWGALLPTRTQAEVLAARLQGRFRYGEHRVYALKSLARSLPAIGMAGLIAALAWAAGEYEAAGQIEAQLAQSEVDDDTVLTDDAAAGLANLMVRSAVTRWRVARDLFTVPTPAGWFASNPEPIVRALVGLDLDRLHTLTNAYVTPDALRHSDPRIRAARYKLAEVAIPDGDPRATTVLPALRDAIIEQLEVNLNLGDTYAKQTNSRVLSRLANAYAAVAGKLKDGDPHVADVLAVLRDAIGKQTSSAVLSGLTDAYAAVAAKLKDGDPHVANELAALRDAIGKQTSSPVLFGLASAYAAVTAKLKDGDPHVADVLAVLRDAIGKQTSSDVLSALANAYAAVAAKLKDGDPHVADVLAALRDAIGKQTSSPVLSGLANAYAAVVAKLKDDDPHVANELAALRDGIGEQTNSFSASVLAKAYAAVAAKLKDGDAHVANELAALRDAIGKQTSSPVLSALAEAYAATAKAARPAKAPTRDISVLLGRLSFLRTESAYVAFSAAINEATRLGRSPLSWDKVGLVYTAVLLQPAAVAEPTRRLVTDYEQIIRQRQDAPKLAESWSGDVWAFARWARDNLPGFDPHQPNVGFLAD